ncbi:MAG: hypothetical protein AB7N71_09660 [Phycisphaerae bacterium]
MTSIATIIAMFFAGFLIMIGAIVIGSAATRRRDPATPDERRGRNCACGRPNISDARYCARCGKFLGHL